MIADSVPAGDADVARVAALIEDRARARVLMMLADGRALPASVLTTEAGVAASTISEHLARLLDAKLLTAERQGRARYFRLADPSVAEALEAIPRISPPEPIRSLRQGTRAHALGRGPDLLQPPRRPARRRHDGRPARPRPTRRRRRPPPRQCGTDRLSAPGRGVTHRLTPDGRRELATRSRPRRRGPAPGGDPLLP